MRQGEKEGERKSKKEREGERGKGGRRFSYMLKWGLS